MVQLRSHLWCLGERKILQIDPIGSMYGIYANIGGILMVNVTIYSIHGSYGYIYIYIHHFQGICMLDMLGIY